MEEAEKIADEVAIIDHGSIIMRGSPKELKRKTGTSSLEDAFLHLTGKKMRREEAHGIDNLRMQGRLWGRR